MFCLKLCKCRSPCIRCLSNFESCAMFVQPLLCSLEGLLMRGLMFVQYMVKSLRKLEGKVVGVVGLGHLAGMIRRWDQLEKQQQRLRT